MQISLLLIFLLFLAKTLRGINLLEMGKRLEGDKPPSTLWRKTSNMTEPYILLFKTFERLIASL